MTKESDARENIDRLIGQAGWSVCDAAHANIHAARGIETHFTNGLDPQPRSRPVFAFHKPESLAAWFEDAEASADYRARGQTVLAGLQHMPALKEVGLWPAQIKAIHNLEQSLKENRPRALIQMGERRVKEPRTLVQGYAGWSSCEAWMRSAEVRPAEWARHGRRTLGFRAERDARAKKHASAASGHISSAIGACSAKVTIQNGCFRRISSAMTGCCHAAIQ